MKPEDELIDALLKEQARKRHADEDLLSSIETTLDGSGGLENRLPAWKRILPLSVAAALAMGGVVIYQNRDRNQPDMAVNEMAAVETDRSNTGVPASELPTPTAARSAAAGEVGAALGDDASGAFGQVPGEPRTRPAEAASTPSATPAGVPGREAMEAPKADLGKRKDVSTGPVPDVAPSPVVDDIARDDRATSALDQSGGGGAGSPRDGQASMNEVGRLATGNKSAPAAAPVEELAEADSEALGLNLAEADPFVASEGHAETKAKVMRTEVPVTPADGIFGRAASESLAKRKKGSARKPMPPTRGKLVEPNRRPVPQEELSRENYGQLVDQPWKTPWQAPLSTFSIDVDTASYTNVRKMIRQGRTIQRDAVRIEEMVNYFDYRYPAPEGDSPFAAHALLATCPWQPEHLLARVAIKGREIDKNARPASNLIFLIDVSGSMQASDKLPMLKRSMQLLIESLDERDRVGIVVYAGTEGVVLKPTLLDERGKSEAIAALGKLESGGSTNGGAGLSRAYKMALNHKVEDGVNRVILATDGDFNVGTTGQGQLVDLVKGSSAKGVSMSVLGFGTGNLNDSMLEAITNDGDGNYFYVDCDAEAERVFCQKLSGTLVTIAKDVKIQVEFNPGKVQAYRLIGYANRVLRNRDFNDDKIDAGEIGAGHTVTAFYEVVPVGVASPTVGDVDELEFQRPANREETELVPSKAWLTLKLRYKHPQGVKSRLIKTPVEGDPVKWQDAGNDFRMASAVALFGMKLRQMSDVSDVEWSQIRKIAKPALADDLHERRAEFLGLVDEME